MSKSISGILIQASLDDEKNGIVMKILTDDRRYVFAHSTTNDPWLKIPEGKDKEKELKEMCDLLNGYKDGELIPNFQPRRITILEG